MKHRLPREEPTESQPVKATNHLAVAPRLDRVSPSQLVQARVCRGDSRRDPGSLPGRVGTARHDFRERSVDADVEATQRPSQRPADPGVLLPCLLYTSDAADE